MPPLIYAVFAGLTVAAAVLAWVFYRADAEEEQD